MSDLPLLVVDASAALAVVFTNEEGAEVETLFRELIAQNGQIHVPSLFWYELGNGLLAAERSGRIDEQQSGDAVAVFDRLPIVTDSELSHAVRSRIAGFAGTHKLTFYEAAYLELSERLLCPLKTFDGHLLALKSRCAQIL